MNLLNTHRFDPLPESEVLRRIGELLAKMLQHDRARRNASPCARQPIADQAELIADPVERQIAKYLLRHGATSGRRLAQELDLSAKPVGQALGRLRAKGFCVQLGRTSDACYRLRVIFGEN